MTATGFGVFDAWAAANITARAAYEPPAPIEDDNTQPACRFAMDEFAKCS
jgi:hypothetical protein